jgi:ATP-dependent Lhr-like helicase
MLIATINGTAVAEHWMARFLLDAGFTAGAMGFNVRRGMPLLHGTRTETRPNA